jgi:hypothetical protein
VSKFVGKFRKDRDTLEDYNEYQKNRKKNKQNTNYKHFADMDHSEMELMKLKPRSRKQLH